MPLPLPLAVVTALAAQSLLPPEVLQLAHMKQKTAASLKALPDYTCSATTARYLLKANSTHEKKVDTVRLEVAHVDSKEMYSWPGESKFNEKPVTEMVRGGMIGDGEFANHVRTLFVRDNGIEKFAGSESVDGRRQLKWDFTIPRLQSGWQITRGTASAVAGAEGSFWADAESLELLRLEIRTADLPPGFPVASVVSQIEYGRVKIGEKDVLLPQTAEMILTTVNGEEHRNVTEYSGCRQFGSASSISFGDLPGDPGPSVAAPAVNKTAERIELPADIPMTIQLTAPIDLEHAAIGDEVRASLASPIRIKKEEIAPKGAVVLGRLRRLEKTAGSFDAYSFTLAIEFTEIRFAGRVATVVLHLRNIDSLIHGAQWIRAEKEENFSGAGSPFTLIAQDAQLKRGTVMTWVTVSKTPE